VDFGIDDEKLANEVLAAMSAAQPEPAADPQPTGPDPTPTRGAHA
jgi:hypothetical protein